LRKISQRSGITAFTAGRGKVVEAAADNLFARQAEEFAGADTGISIPAIVVVIRIGAEG